MTRAAAGADHRLVPPALAAWAASAATTVALSLGADAGDRRAASTRGVVVGVALLLLGLVLAGRVVLGGRPVARARASQRPRTVAVLLALVVLASGAAVVAAAATRATLAAGPVADAADARALVVADAVVATDARRRSARASGSWRGPDRWEARVVLTRLRTDATAFRLDVPVLLRLPPDVRDPPEVGETVRVHGRLRPAAGTSDVAAVLTARELTTTAAAGPVDAGANAMRSGLRRALDGADRDAAALVAGLAVGDESVQPPELADAMRRSGLSHLTAVSGGNVAIVVLGVLAAARAAGLRGRGRALVAAAALVGFVVLVRPQPSVLRAAAMGAVLVVSLVTGGTRRGVPALSAAVLALVLLAPPLALSYGFALSTAATAGLLVLLPRLRTAALRARVLARCPPPVLDALLVTGAAQIATAPLLVALGSGIGLVALPANLLAAPAVAPVTVLGLASALLAPLLPAAAVLPARVAAVPAGAIAWIAHRGAEAPLATVPWPSGWGGAVLLLSTVGVGLIGAGLMRRRGLRVHRRVVRCAVAAAAVAVLALLLRPPGRAGWPPPGWVLVACDVGQGDALALRADEQSAVVVDAGPDAVKVDRCLSDLGVTRVPAIVLTHFHADHVEGLPGVLRSRSVGTVLATPLRDPPEEADRVADWLRERGLAVTAVAAGEERSVGQLRWRVVWPRRVIRGEESVPNNASVVLLAEVDGVRMLLGGDVEPAAQAEIVAENAPPRVDVVKVPHHGSRFQDDRLPTWSGGRIALVSVGAGNDYGHPDSGTLARWRAAGALVARTDEAGDLAVVRLGDGRVGLVTRQ